MSLIASTKPTLQQTAELLKASADPLRLLILKVLTQNSYNVAELCEIFQIRQPALSHHLKLLASSSLITSRKEGTSAFYRIDQSPSAQAQLRKALLQSLDEIDIDDETTQHLESVHKQRASASAQFFAENVDSFREQQDLIADFPAYGELVAQIIERVCATRGIALEVGPGKGELLPFLASRFEQVQAVDISSEMLREAETTIVKQGISNVELIHGSTSSEFIAPADLIVINMVLHHTPAPREIFKDLAQQLKPNAKLVVCDLVRHEQNWVKSACGDLWQGFDPEELISWAQEAGLTQIEQHLFAQRNGFQFQIQIFNELGH